MADHSTIVIGSGIAGAATAFALARRGSSVAIVDPGEPGQATAASAGIIQPWSSTVEGPFYDVYAAGAAHYPTLLDSLADAGVRRTDYRRSGALLVHEDPDLLATARQRVLDRAVTARDVVGAVDDVSAADVHRLFPVLAEGLPGVFIEGGGRVDGRTLRDALLAGAARYGAHVRHGRADLQATATGIPGVRVMGRLLEADAVVVAAGAWTPAVLAPLAQGLDLGIEPQRGQITHLRLEGVDTSRWPSVHPLSHHYLVAFEDSRIAVGATRETGSGFDVRITAAGQKQVLEDALRLAPGLADATFLETRVGLRPRAEGELPVFGPVAGSDGLFVVTGFGAGGLTMGPFVGELLADLVLDGVTAFPVEPYAPRAFVRARAER